MAENQNHHDISDFNLTADGMSDWQRRALILIAVAIILGGPTAVWVLAQV